MVNLRTPRQKTAVRRELTKYGHCPTFALCYIKLSKSNELRTPCEPNHCIFTQILPVRNQPFYSDPSVCRTSEKIIQMKISFLVKVSFVY